MRLSEAATISDLAAMARRRLPRFVFDFLDGGAGGERGVARNEERLQAILLKPSYGRGVAPDLGVRLFGRDWKLPIGVAPVGMAGLIWPGAELALARLAQAKGMPFVLSTAGTTPIEAIAAAAQELNALRERWLNPPEWTVEKILEFPGTTGGPWQRYLDAKTVDTKTGIGTVRYPRLEPRDADCAAKLKKRTLTNLYNERPAWLDLAHKKLDATVAAAYGLPTDLTDEQILEKLLALNLERAAAEDKSMKVKQPKAQRGKVDEEMI